jgi:uncharacterized membrane protein
MTREAGRRANRIGWALLLVFTTLIASYAFMLVFVPGSRPPFVRTSPYPFAFLMHMFGGGIAMAIVPWQLKSSLRWRRPDIHRALGWVYMTAVFMGGVAALRIAPLAQEGLWAALGFGGLGVAWLVTSALAFSHIRRGDYDAHRRWVLRSVSLTLAAVMLRLYLPVSLVLGLPFSIAYPAIAWLCWVPNLIVADWFVRRPEFASVDPRP